MNHAAPAADAASPAARRDHIALGLVLAGLSAAYLPTYWSFLYGAGAAYAQGHELLVLAVTGWLLYRQRERLVALPPSASLGPAIVLLTIGVLLYLFGRSQRFLRPELLSQVFVVASLLIGWRGWNGLKVAAFALFFLLFVIPLPFTLTQAITGSMKSAVSAASTQLLFWAGYPVGRSGVIITIGQYELLVSTACAGLQTLVTLESLGLLYLNLKGYRSWLRNALLALLVVPVSLCANVIRVAVLALVTYHFGDQAGRGFFHGFAGMVLFLSALLLIVSVDRLLGWALPAGHRR